jgi:hypothetical protein
MSRSRQRHWLCALKKKAAAFFGFDYSLIEAFDRLMSMGQIPVSRTL